MFKPAQTPFKGATIALPVWCRCARRAIVPAVLSGSTGWNDKSWCGKFEAFEPEARRDSAPNQRPVSKRARRLPVICRNNCLRNVRLQKRGSQNMRLVRTLRVWRDTQLQWLACVEVPYLGGVDPMPVAALSRFQQEKDRGPAWASIFSCIGDPCLAIPATFRMGLKGKLGDYVVCCHVLPVLQYRNGQTTPQVTPS